MRYKEQKTKDALATEVAKKKRRAPLHSDWRLLTAAIVRAIKQHWNILEDKFEQYVDEDDYGNRFIDATFSDELMYFGHKIVEPALGTLIDSGQARANSLALLPAPPTTTEDLYGIRYEDSDAVIASKYVSGLLSDGKDSSVSDELLHAMYGGGMVTVENGSDNPHDKVNLLTLALDGSLQANRPMRVTHLGGIVFILFYAMYTSRPIAGVAHSMAVPADFTGNDPYKYEEFIRKMLHARGYNAKRTRGSGDFGVDVIASKHGKKFVIQCKLYNHSVGFKAVQEIVGGRVYYKADYAVVVSDNSFTPAARNMARRSDVVLAHHKDLLHKLDGLISEGNEAPDDSEPIQAVDTRIPEQATKQRMQDDDLLVSVVLPIVNGK